ncbi:MAG: hypothetical protein V7720_06140 [Halioglobus sp.]
MPATYTVLGTDGFVFSGSRPELRDHFELSARYIVPAALKSLHRQGAIDAQTLHQQLAPLDLAVAKADPAAR